MLVRLPVGVGHCDLVEIGEEGGREVVRRLGDGVRAAGWWFGDHDVEQ